MGVFITWLIIILFIGLLLGMFKPRFLRFFFPIKKSLNRKHNLAIFGISLVVCFVGLFIVLRSSVNSKEITDEEMDSFLAESGDVEVDLHNKNAMSPDPDAQKGAVFTEDKDSQKVKDAKAEAEKELTTKKVYGCTDPTASNYNPKATVNDGSCVNTASD